MICRLPLARLTIPLALLSLVSSCGGDPGPRTRAQPVSLAPPPRAIPRAAIPRTPPPQVAAESSIVLDYASGRVLYAKNADLPRPVASTQKIITALTVVDAGRLDQTVVIEPSDGACEPTKLYLKPGECYTRRELLKALMVKSGNDVARALARDVGGSQEQFAALMNHKCRQLGMRQSYFVNPHGLPDPGQMSTARDIAIAARAAYRDPIIRSFASTRQYTFQYSGGRTRVLENTNRLLKRVPYCDGMKTGTTNAAGRCLVTTGSLGGRAAIVVVLKSTSRAVWDDSEKLLRWALESPADP
jgi:D-alanyl-D-alanine carboxypeptidase (penicillin-binding protein 5/6)